MKRKSITVAVSGAFDPIHVGHIRYIREAAKLGDRLVVILNRDGFLLRKKGLFLGRSRIEKKSSIALKVWMRLLPPSTTTRQSVRPWNWSSLTYSPKEDTERAPKISPKQRLAVPSAAK